MAKEKKKRKNERADGRLCKNITIGRNEDGSLKRKMIYANTQAELNLKVSELLLQKDKGIIIDDKGMTVDKWADEWLETYKSDLAPGTVKKYRSTIRKHIKPNFKGVRLKDLKQYQIKKVLNEIDNSVPSRFLSTMKQMLDDAVNNDYVSKNVAYGLTVKKYHDKTKEPLSSEIINIIKATPHEIQNICLFLIYSGLRIGELRQLTWSDIDLKKKMISITDNEDKSVKTPASIRDVPIVKPLLDLIKAIEGDRIKNINKSKDYVFKHNGEMYSISKLGSLRYEYNELCGCEFTYHQCRHTCASLLYYAGVGIKEAQEWLGHASANVTMDIYTHLREKEKETATNKIDEYLKSI